MQLTSLLLPLFLAFPATVHAVFEDEVGHIDYHHELLGVPQCETTFFHRPRQQEKASLLYTLSDLGVVGAINPSSGAVVWRQQLNGNSTASRGHLRAGEDEPWLVSALDNAVQAWDATTGRNIWSLHFDGSVKDLEIMEMTGAGQKDVLVLFDEGGTTVARRIHGTEGRVVWEYSQVTKDVPLQVSTNVEKVFVITLHGSLLSYSLHVLVLDTATGKKLDEIVISTKGEIQGKGDVMFVGANSAAPVVAWTDNNLNNLKVNVLGTKAKVEFPLTAGAVSVEVHAPHTVQSSAHFLVHTRTETGNKGEVYHVDLKTNAVALAYELPLLDGPGAFSTSSSASNVYFTRVTTDEITITASGSHGVIGRWPLPQKAAGAAALHGVSEVLSKAGGKYSVRSAVVTDTDDWMLIYNGEFGWTRPEGLSGAVAATWAEIPESEEFARTLEAEAHNNPLTAYIHRVNRHIQDLQHLPAWLQSIPSRFISSVLGTDGPTATGVLAKDSFGFHKLVVLATKRGKIYGLDAGNSGRIVWRKNGHESPATIPWDVKAIHADDRLGLVTIRGAHGEFIIVRSENGQTVEVMPAGLMPAIDGAIAVDSEAGPWLLPISLGGELTEVPNKWAPKQVIVTRTASGALQGSHFVAGTEQATPVPVWTFSAPKGFNIVNVASRSKHDPIASIGRILGDRSVKYKYLNPNTLVVAASDESTASLTIYLLDSVSGQILTSSTFEGIDGSKDVTCALAENWFTCTFYGEYTLRDTPTQALRGYQIVITDLYESEVSNDRGELGDTTDYSALDPIDLPSGAPLPHAESKTFVLSSALTSLAVTQTRQGITTRQVLAYAPELHSIAGLPRPLLEPRRPAGRDPTAAEMEEGLSRYQAAIELDPRIMITHERDVLGVREIITSPANLESTSLVFAYGIDIFGTRVAPSMAFDVLGQGFNKATVVSTVLALVAGVAVLAPIVRKKQIDLRWQATG
ncbi:ER membrane protein complex subunit 1 [Microdochium nivale]|nr:ER membrane protein complex subunit 1 [Microdochium nivale]